MVSMARRSENEEMGRGGSIETRANVRVLDRVKPALWQPALPHGCWPQGFLAGRHTIAKPQCYRVIPPTRSISMRHTALALIFALTATAAFADGPAAQDLQPLSDASATRTATDEVRLQLTFDGGACQAVNEPQVGEVTDGAVSVTIPTTKTAEICTMQIVAVPVDVTVQVPSEATALQVTVLATDGTPQFGGRVEIAD
jgi:hypothetical protein